MTGRSATLVSIVVALGVVAGLDSIGASWVRGDSVELTPDVARAENVVIIENTPERLPPPRPGPSVILVGNSHTYALPALERGRPLRPDPGVTLIDELAGEVGGDATFYRLAYPNFLPFEMLTRVAQMYDHGYRPDVVVIGLTWRNIARDSALRYQIARVFRASGFAERFAEMLGPDYPKVVERIEARAREVAREQEEERTKSSADRVDAALSELFGRYVALIGKSRVLRARLYRGLNVALTERFVPKTEYAYDVVSTDLAFNRRCVAALLDLLHDRGARVILYQAPQRSDYAPLMDPTGQAEVLGEIEKRAETFGFVMLDARRVVPNELWGFAYDAADRSHFTEPGHKALAHFLFENGRSTFRILERDR